MLTSCTKIIYEDFDPDNEQHENTEQTNNGEDENQDEKNENVVVSVAEFFQNDYSQKSVWVKGYIVGCCYQNIKNAVWTPPFPYDTSILLADEPGETDSKKVIAIQLKTKEDKETLGLHSNPQLYNKEIKFFGKKQKYLGIWGIKE